MNYKKIHEVLDLLRDIAVTALMYIMSALFLIAVGYGIFGIMTG